MRTTICVFVAAMIAVVGAENAFADAEAGQGYFSVMGSYIDDDKDRNGSPEVNNAVAVGRGGRSQLACVGEVFLHSSTVSSDGRLGMGDKPPIPSLSAFGENRRALFLGLRTEPRRPRPGFGRDRLLNYTCVILVGLERTP